MAQVRLHIRNADSQMCVCQSFQVICQVLISAELFSNVSEACIYLNIEKQINSIVSYFLLSFLQKGLIEFKMYCNLRCLHSDCLFIPHTSPFQTQILLTISYFCFLFAVHHLSPGIFNFSFIRRNSARDGRGNRMAELKEVAGGSQ